MRGRRSACGNVQCVERAAHRAATDLEHMATQWQLYCLVHAIEKIATKALRMA